MKAYEAIRVIVSALKEDELVISANGLISRELYSVRDRSANFYMLGSMGLASSIGLGLAISLPKRRVLVLDGDGNLLMNMGSLATIGQISPKNLVHVVLDNESYESTGGQATASRTAELDKVAKACGFKTVKKALDSESLSQCIRELLRTHGPAFCLVKTEKGWDSVPRVGHAPETIKTRFRSQLV